jgi:hypothetical protein
MLAAGKAVSNVKMGLRTMCGPLVSSDAETIRVGCVGAKCTLHARFSCSCHLQTNCKQTRRAGNVGMSSGKKRREEESGEGATFVT